jgi:hypothetical protein
MAQAKCRVDCQTYTQADASSPGRVFDAGVTVAPTDDERLAHGGCRAVVDEEQDTKVKISEALEAAARAVGDHPVERSDAAAIHAAEERAVGTGVAIPAGIAAQAQAAADANATAAHGDDKITIRDVLKVRTVLRTTGTCMHEYIHLRGVTCLASLTGCVSVVCVSGTRRRSCLRARR